MKYFFLGRRIRHCGYAEAWNLRLFRHRLGRYERMPVDSGTKTGDNEAHEHVELEGKALRLVHELDHHAYPTIAAWVEKHNRYAVWEAAMYERFLREPIPASIGPGKRFKRMLKKVYLRLPMRPLVRFLYAYVARRGFLDGKPGLVFCSLLSFYDFLAWANVYERSLGDQGPLESLGKASPSRPPVARSPGSTRLDGPGARAPIPCRDRSVERVEAPGLAFGVVGAGDGQPGGLAEGVGPFAIQEQGDDRAGQRRGVAVGDDQAGCARLDQRAEALHVGGDDGQAAGHRLQEGSADGGGQRGLAVDVQDLPEREADGQVVGEGQPFGDPESLGPPAQVPPRPRPGRRSKTRRRGPCPRPCGRRPGRSRSPSRPPSARPRRRRALAPASALRPRSSRPPPPCRGRSGGSTRAGCRSRGSRRRPARHWPRPARGTRPG